MRKALLGFMLLLMPRLACAQQEYVGRYDGYAAFSYLDFPSLNLQQRGFNTQFGVNITRWLGAGFDYSVQSGSASLGPGDVKLPPALVPFLPPGLTVPFDATTQTFTGGPQFAYRHFKHVTLLGHPTIGAIHEHVTLKSNPTTQAVLPVLISFGVPIGTSMSDTTYFYGAGGGADVLATKHLHFRVDVEYVHVFLFDNLLKRPHDAVRVSVGHTFNFGKNVVR